MSKVKSAALRHDITHMVVVIREKHLKLEEADKKELAFIHKHLRKAAKEMVRIAARLKQVPPRKKRPVSARKSTKRPARAGKTAAARPKPPLENQANA